MLDQTCKFMLDQTIGNKVRSIVINGNQNNEVMELLSACTGNVKQLTLKYSNNCMEWLTADILSRWKLKEIDLKTSRITIQLVSIVIKTCTELTSIKLDFDNIDDAAVTAIAQHCPKLETLHLFSSNIRWTALCTLSEQGLPLEVLHVPNFPTIPSADIARRCSHALSRIRFLFSEHISAENAEFCIPFMTGLTSVCVEDNYHSYIPLLTQHCTELTEIEVCDRYCPVSDILSLCHVNPLLQELRCHCRNGMTDTVLIELIHACPHLHTLYLPYAADISDIGILAFSERCPQLQKLTMNRCHQVTETAVLHLLHRCHKLTRLFVSRSSLSEETWIQLDKNTQKKVSRY